MPFFYFDESIHDRGGFVLGAYVYGPDPTHAVDAVLVVERRRQLIFVGVAADRANLGAEDAIGKELSWPEPPEIARWTESGRCRERLHDVMPTSRTVSV